VKKRIAGRARGAFIPKHPPTHQTAREIGDLPWTNVPSEHRPLGSCHAGFGGWDIPTPLALEYACNVIADHRDTIRALLLPSMLDEDRAEWLITLEVCGWLRELMCEPDFKFPVRFPLAGFVRFKDWDESQLQWQVFAYCAIFEEELREIFLTPESDPLSALEWAEVLKFADVIHQRQTGGDEKSTLKPCLDTLVSKAALRAHTERPNYLLDSKRALVRRDVTATEPASTVAA